MLMKKEALLEHLLEMDGLLDRLPDIRNPVHLLSYIRPSMTEDELTFVLRTTLYNMSRLLRSDGGFSRELAHSPSAPNVAQVKNGASYPGMPKPVHLSQGLVEGDMNAATQALLIRSFCYAMADETPPKLVLRADTFYESSVLLAAFTPLRRICLKITDDGGDLYSCYTIRPQHRLNGQGLPATR